MRDAVPNFPVLPHVAQLCLRSFPRVLSDSISTCSKGCLLHRFDRRPPAGLPIEVLLLPPEAGFAALCLHKKAKARDSGVLSLQHAKQTDCPFHTTTGKGLRLRLTADADAKTFCCCCCCGCLVRECVDSLFLEVVALCIRPESEVLQFRSD